MRRIRPWSLTLSLSISLLGCSSPLVDLADDGGSTGTADETTPTPTSAGGTTGPSTTSDPSTPSTSSASTGPAETASSATSAPATTEGSGESTDGETNTFLQKPDWPSDSECSTWTQDCPDGLKCMPWASDGGATWNALRCSPIAPAPDQAGEPCTVEGNALSGLDSCDLGSMCLGNEPGTLTGTCTSFCEGSPEMPSCEADDFYCHISGEGVLALCTSTCNPLAQNCNPNEGCYVTGDAFTCVPDASSPGNGGYLDPCQFLNECQPGNMCLLSTLLPDCGGSGCCTPFCDVTNPSCPDPSLSCEPYFEPGTAPLGLDAVGICLAS